MKNLTLAVLCTFSSLAVLAQSKVLNDPHAQVRNVKGFHAIEVSGGIHLYLVQGNEEAVAVSASDASTRDRIKTEVTDGVLKIYFDNYGWHFWDGVKRNLKAYVSCKELQSLHVSSGSRVDVDGSLTGNKMTMHFSSGANFNGKVAVGSLQVEEGSGAETNFSGTASNLKVHASSGASFQAYDLLTDSCDASSSSGASLKITVNKELSASAHSGGQIHYKGAGLIRDLNTGSGGEVTRQ